MQQLQPHHFGILCRMIIIKICKMVNNFKRKPNNFLFSQTFVGKVFFCILSANVVKFVGSLVLLSDCKALLNHWEKRGISSLLLFNVLSPSNNGHFVCLILQHKIVMIIRVNSSGAILSIPIVV